MSDPTTNGQGAGSTAAPATSPSAATAATSRAATSLPTALPAAPGERTVGQLVADASRDLSAIMRAEIALAKAELQADVKAAGTGIAMFVVAGVFAFLALILLLIAIAYGLVAAGLPPWAAFLLVALVLLALTGTLALVGRSKVRRAGPPERTLRTTRETVETLKGVKPHTR